MTLDAIVKEDGTLIAKAPKSFWGKQVKVTIQDEPPILKRQPTEAAVSETCHQAPGIRIDGFPNPLITCPCDV